MLGGDTETRLRLRRLLKILEPIGLDRFGGVGYLFVKVVVVLVVDPL